MRASLKVRETLGCSLYDAVSPALAKELGSRLYSADRRAHGGWPDVTIIE